MEKIKFVPLTHTSGTTTYVRADTITELTKDGDRTIVYTSYLDKPFKVKERLDKILAEIGGNNMVAIKGKKMPKGCQHCKYFRKNLFGNGLDYSYSCMEGATEFPMPWIRQMEERASDCPLVEIITCKDCKHWRDSDGKYRRGCGAESKCPINSKRVYEGNCYCAYAERKEK